MEVPIDCISFRLFNKVDEGSPLHTHPPREKGFDQPTAPIIYTPLDPPIVGMEDGERRSDSVDLLTAGPEIALLTRRACMEKRIS